MMRCARTLAVVSILALFVAGRAAGQEAPPLTPEPAPNSATAPGPATESPGVDPPVPPRSAPAGGATITPRKPKAAAPVAAPRTSPAAAAPGTAAAPPAAAAPEAPTSPANEPSVLPPDGVPFVPTPELEPLPEIKIPDTGPGSINRPLLSVEPDAEPVREAQPVPVMELSVFFGAVLLLSGGYLTYTARVKDEDDAPERGPSGGS